MAIDSSVVYLGMSKMIGPGNAESKSLPKCNTLRCGMVDKESSLLGSFPSLLDASRSDFSIWKSESSGIITSRLTFSMEPTMSADIVVEECQRLKFNVDEVFSSCCWVLGARCRSRRASSKPKEIADHEHKTSYESHAKTKLSIDYIYLRIVW